MIVRCRVEVNTLLSRIELTRFAQPPNIDQEVHRCNPVMMRCYSKQQNEGDISPA
jgi:hypothetical protein